MTSRAERHVVVPVELLSDLWRYGNLNRIDGVLYGKSHADRLKEADDILCKALSAAPPVQMEAVAWRVGVPNNEYATLHEDVAEIARKHGYEVTPLYASPVPSSERDDTWHLPNDPDGTDYWREVIGGWYKPVRYSKHRSWHPTTVKEELERHKGQPVADVLAGLVFTLSINREREKFLLKDKDEEISSLRAERDNIIEMCAKVAEAFSEVSARAGGGLASEASAACSAVASSIRSLKSQPAQEAE